MPNSLDAVRPHIDQIAREGYVALTRDGLEGEREHFITHPVQVGGESKIAVVVARARANGEMEVLITQCQSSRLRRARAGSHQTLGCQGFG